MDNNKIMRAKIRLLIEQPFFANLLMHMEIIEDESIQTACTDGVKMWINPNFFYSLTEPEQLFLLAHEVMHPALLHHTRRGVKDARLWNIACDYALNPILVDSGMKMPSCGLLDRKFDGMSAERIYTELEKDCQKHGGKGGDCGDGECVWQAGDGFDGGLGDVKDFGGGDNNQDGEGSGCKIATASEIAEEEQRQIQSVISSYSASKTQGKISAGIERFINEILDPQIHWSTILEQWISEKIYDDFTWTKPNSRYVSQGFYFPSLESETFAEVACIMDSSGSVTQNEANIMASEMNAIGDLMKSVFHVIYCDSKVAGYDVFESGDNIELNVKGGGGTDFRPPFDFIEKEGLDQDIKVAIYFTDGECNSFPEEPSYPVLWVITPNEYYNYRNKGFKPPFGETIYM